MAVFSRLLAHEHSSTCIGPGVEPQLGFEISIFTVQSFGGGLGVQVEPIVQKTFG